MTLLLREHIEGEEGRSKPALQAEKKMKEEDEEGRASRSRQRGWRQMKSLVSPSGRSLGRAGDQQGPRLRHEERWGELLPLSSPELTDDLSKAGLGRVMAVAEARLKWTGSGR